jgi:L-cysteine:1D-myo-inositol 2-amino-2-deoxy-alpha-D-glucopyranoside ligase
MIKHHIQHNINATLVGFGYPMSLGNLVFIGDLLERYESGAVRRYLLEHHYRADWEHDETALQESATAWKAWKDAGGGDGRREDLVEAFHAALHDDLDTPRALGVLDEAARAGAGATLRELAAVLGFGLDE